jgi:hypothetical protein
MNAAGADALAGGDGGSPAIRHNILDFYARELVTLVRLWRAIILRV